MRVPPSASSSRPLVVDDALNYDDASPKLTDYIRAQAKRLGVRSQINYPLIVKGQFRGVLSIHQTDRTRRWAEEEISLVEALAERLSIGIAQAELFEMVSRGKTEWETTFDAMSDGIFIFDRAGELKRVNRAGAAMEALHPRLLLGRQCCDILRSSEEDGACVVENALETGRSVTIEITPSRLNRPLLVSVEPVLDENNNAVAVVCTARDLSDLRKVQAVAREHQSLLTNILESARESIYALYDERFVTFGEDDVYEQSDAAGFGFLAMVTNMIDRLTDQDRALLPGAILAEQRNEGRLAGHAGFLREFLARDPAGETARKGKRAEKIGVVTSDKMMMTVVVRVDRLVKHPIYRKYVRKRKKFMAHDEFGAKVGDNAWAKALTYFNGTAT